MKTKDEYINELKTINEALVQKIRELNENKNKKHDDISLKWRNQCFYWKNECSKLRKLLEGGDENVRNSRNGKIQRESNKI